MVKQNDYLMTNREIIGGLRSAIERGEKLKDAMMTFYQAGYSKIDIEEAARVYLSQTGKVPEAPLKRIQTAESADVKKKQPEIPAPTSDKKTPLIPTPKIPKPIDKKTPQIVSSYGVTKKQKESGRTLTITLIIILTVLLGALALVFLFNTEFVDFFNKMFD